MDHVRHDQHSNGYGPRYEQGAPESPELLFRALELQLAGVAAKIIPDIVPVSSYAVAALINVHSAYGIVGHVQHIKTV